jgi:RNA polymerase-binding transcription factor DksA|tara:strand:- start:7 stop:207 length:201 start_codon:yes stop_codon:yes gene_type:complete
MKEYPNCDWRKYKMARLNKKRFCKVCGIEIDNSKRKINKRTKYCSKNCVDEYNEIKKERKLNDKSI